jgi:predicted Zn-dependent peptidase
MGIAMSGLSEHFDDQFKHFQGTILNPHLKSKFLSHQKKILKRFITNESTNPVKVCFNTASKLMFPSHSYGLPSVGSLESIQKINWQ